MRLIFFLTVIIIFPAIGFSATIHVPGNYPEIQLAIDAAVNGDIVLVAPKTYLENIDFMGKAITVTSEQGPDVTIIDGNDAGSVVTCQSGEDEYSVLNGFTITNGNNSYGGGMRIDGSSPTVMHCTFSNNSANNGGGMHNINNSGPTVINCIFAGNSAGDGGGMYNNVGSNPTISDCIFTENLGVPGAGGGMLNNGGSNPIIYNCIFSENSASDYHGGGGMDNQHNCSPTVTNCTFTGNSAKFGAGMNNWNSSNTIVTNCIFTKNQAVSHSGGLNNWSSSPVVLNCTFTENSAINYGSGMANQNSSSPTVTNCILWADINDEIYNDSSSSISVTHSCVEGGWPGKGNIGADPLFVDPSNDDFHLTFTSPCKDSGDNLSVTVLEDFEGDPRIAYSTVDIGADEFYTHLYWTGDATPGGNVELKFVGLPGTSPVGLCIGTGVLDPSIPSMWGDWYLQFPIIGPMDLGSITSPEGVLIIPGYIPTSPPAPYSIPMQALIGAELTDLCVLEVQ